MTKTKTSPQSKFAITRKELTDSLIERSGEVDLLLTALIAREHCLLVGPPGTAKSMLADAVVRWMQGTKFSILMTKFTTPEEVCGPVSLTGLKRDVFQRITTGKLPEASCAFLDEIFKSSSAILNTILTILNERTYNNGGTLMRCPLAICIGASNEWPGDQEGGKEVAALFDRFLLRKLVRPIATEPGRERLLWGDVQVALSTTITPEEIEQAAVESAGLQFTDEAKSAFGVILKELRTDGIHPGDRRCRKAVRACQAFAYLDGASEVEPDHLEIAMHCLWDDPAEQPKKVAEIVARVANPVGAKVNELLLESEEIMTSANLRDLGQTVAANKKLEEIKRKLEKLSGDRAQKGLEHVKDNIKKVRLATVEMV